MCVSTIINITILNVQNLSLLAENCDEANYVRLVEALCRENQIPVLKIGDNKTLGEWAGLCKIDREGNARKERIKNLCFVTIFAFKIEYIYGNIYF